MRIISTDCIQVKGFNRSTICDLRRQEYYEGPCFESIQDLDLEHMSFLYDCEVIIDIPDELKENFPPIDLSFNSYSHFTNAVINFNGFLMDIIEILLKVRCLNVAIIIDGKEDLISFFTLLVELSKSNINQIELHIINMDCVGTINILEEKALANSFLIPSIYFKSNNIESFYKKFNTTRIIYRYEETFNKDNIEMDDFYCNIELFKEAQHHNTYFNKKIFIDDNGYVSNTYKGNVFGNILEIKEDGLINLANDNPKFTSLWYVAKDIIDVCKHCEYRYLCIDARIPEKRNETEWYHVTDCNYNPFICKWKNEPGFLSVNQCGIVSNSAEFSVDNNVLTKIIDNLCQE